MQSRGRAYLNVGLESTAYLHQADSTNEVPLLTANSTSLRSEMLGVDTRLTHDEWRRIWKSVMFDVGMLSIFKLQLQSNHLHLACHKSS